MTIMDTHKSQSSHSDETVGKWINSLAKIIQVTDGRAESPLRTILSCDIQDDQPCLFVPPDMASLQPNSLRFLRTFSRQHALKLIEDRRHVEVQPIIEQRNRSLPPICTEVSALLKQTGMPGDARSLSHPHRLNPDSVHISVQRLINMAASASSKSKKVVVLPKSSISDALDNNTVPITAYACKIQTDDLTSILSHFDSPTFRAIGYSAGSQYVMHVFFAGGPLRNPQLWAPLKTLTRTNFRFQLYPGSRPEYDFGIFYSTFYFDLNVDPKPWWLSGQTGDDLDIHKSNRLTQKKSFSQQSSL